MIFISYQHDSIEFALRLRQRLDSVPLTSFLDPDIEAGERWKEVIDANLDECVALIVIVTVKALKSPYVTYEWSYALGQHKRIIPIILEMPDPENPSHPKLHPQINDIQYRNFEEATEEQWSELLTEVTKIVHREHIPYDIRQAIQEATSTNPATRKNAFDALKNHEDDTESAIYALRKLVLSNFTDVSIEAAFTLCQKSRYRDEYALKGLRRALKQGSIRVFEEGVQCLTAMGTDAAVECIGERLANTRPGENLYLERLIDQGLCQIMSLAAIKELIRVEESGLSKRTATLDALGNFGDPIALPVLIKRRRELASNEYAQESHRRAILAIGKIDHRDARQELVRVLKENQIFSESWQSIFFKAARDCIIASANGNEAIEFLEAELKDKPTSIYTNELHMIIAAIRNNLRQRE